MFVHKLIRCKRMWWSRIKRNYSRFWVNKEHTKHNIVCFLGCLSCHVVHPTTHDVLLAFIALSLSRLLTRSVSIASLSESRESKHCAWDKCCHNVRLHHSWNNHWAMLFCTRLPIELFEWFCWWLGMCCSYWHGATLGKLRLNLDLELEEGENEGRKKLGEGFLLQLKQS